MSPIRQSGDASNHDFATAWTINSTSTPLAIREGSGTVIAFFDSGLDLDTDATTPGPQNHPVFATGSGTRILGSFLVPGDFIDTCGDVQPAIDCNDAGVNPYVAGITHPDARHGTGMASVAAGYLVPQRNQPAHSGHAPQAEVVCFGVTRGFALRSQGLPGCTTRWNVDADAYLTAIQMLTTWNADRVAQGLDGVDVLNVSFDGWPDPTHPVNLALDELSIEQNILVVVGAANSGDSTWASIGAHNALSVGAIYKRLSGSNTFWPTSYTSRGPLQGNQERFYPDVCAVGGDFNSPPASLVSIAHVDQPAMPANTFYETAGTSVAAPQVSGAASLYIARRKQYPPMATALEIKAAILACAADPYAINPYDPNTYKNRNGLGVGFVKDTYLVEYSERFGAGHPNLGSTLPRAAESQTLPAAAGSVVNVPWATSGTTDDQVVAIAWNSGPQLASSPAPNVDLEIWDTAATPNRIARSASLANSYERVVFRSPTVAVTIRIINRSGSVAALTVQVAARKHPQNHQNKQAVEGMIEVLPQPTGCVPANKPNQSVTRVVPSTYDQAYGSRPFQLAPTYGTGFAMPYGANHFIYAGSLVGSVTTIKALCLRSWAPMVNQQVAAGGTIQISFLGLANTSDLANPIDPVSSANFFSHYGTSGVQVAGGSAPLNVNIAPPLAYQYTESQQVPKPTYLNHSALNWNCWNIRVPFSTPFTFSGPNLAVWWEATWSSGQNVQLNVDGILDGGNPPSTLVYWRPQFQSVLPGLAPVMGLVGIGSAAPTLQAFGDPRPDQWVWLSAHGFGGPQGSNATITLHWGWDCQDTPLSGCMRYFAGPPQTLITHPWSAFTQYVEAAVQIFPPPSIPSLLYRDVCVQAIGNDGSTITASNGIKLRIGGRL